MSREPASIRSVRTQPPANPDRVLRRSINAPLGGPRSSSVSSLRHHDLLSSCVVDDFLVEACGLRNQLYVKAPMMSRSVILLVPADVGLSRGRLR